MKRYRLDVTLAPRSAGLVAFILQHVEVEAFDPDEAVGYAEREVALRWPGMLLQAIERCVRAEGGP